MFDTLFHYLRLNLWEDFLKTTYIDNYCCNSTLEFPRPSIVTVITAWSGMYWTLELHNVWLKSHESRTVAALWVTWNIKSMGTVYLCHLPICQGTAIGCQSYKLELKSVWQYLEVFVTVTWSEGQAVAFVLRSRFMTVLLDFIAVGFYCLFYN